MRENAAAIQADAKLTEREWVAGLPEGHTKIVAQAIETAAGVFQAGTFRGASTRLIALTWGPEDLSAELGAEANRDGVQWLTVRELVQAIDQGERYYIQIGNESLLLTVQKGADGSKKVGVGIEPGPGRLLSLPRGPG